MSRPLRLAFGRIAQETNALSPVKTTLEDFRRAHLMEGPALLAACQADAHEAEGFVKNAELSGFVKAAHAASRRGTHVEAVPLVSAWAIPSGPLDRATYDTLVDRTIELLKAAGDVDGTMLCLHGAMGVDGVRDPESRIVERVREASGGKPVVVTHDLHGNLTRARVEASLAICAYQTNPHRDHASVGQKAGEILIRAAAGEVRPVTAWRTLPMILGGGMTIDFLPPMRKIFARARAMERDRKVLSASVFNVHPWNDDPALGWSTTVTTDGDRDLAERYADALAELCWSVRDVPPPAFPAPAEAIAMARQAKLARALGVVCFADASDVVSAGAPGENTLLLAALLEHAGDLKSYVPLRDPVVVEALWSTPIGERVTVTVGGKLDPTRSDGLAVTGVVKRAQRMAGMGRMIVLDLGAVQLVLTELSAFAVKPAFYADVGLPILEADIVVVKNFFPFRLYYLPYARKTIYVRTRGVTDLDAAFALEFDGPVHPRDKVDEWRSRDAKRRGVG